MRATSASGIALRTLVAAGVNLLILGVVLGFVVGVGTFSTSYFLRLLPVQAPPSTVWVVSGVIGGTAAVSFVAWSVHRALIEGRRRLLDGTERLTATDHDASADIEATVDRFAAHLDLPAPSVRLHPSSAPLAYSTYRPDDPVLPVGAVDPPVVVVSAGLLSVLSERERNAVLAHELAHQVNEDLRLTAWLLVPLFVGEALADDDGRIANMFDIVGQATVAVASLGVCVFTRGREFAADRAAAKLTGDPAALASALERIHEHGTTTPTEDLRVHSQSVRAVTVFPTGDPVRFRTHPPLEVRLAQLRAVAA